jgi:hypothetical protein
MTATYEWLAEFAQRAGTLYFFLFFPRRHRLRILAQEPRAL